MLFAENLTPAFGPGGNSEEFYAAGNKSTKDAPAWVKETGLDAYEYEAGNGIAANAATLAAIGEEARRHGVRMSFHTPYFISLSGVDPEKRLKSIVYIKESLAAAKLLGAKTIVVHSGSAAKISREEAMMLASDTLLRLMEEIGDTDIAIGLETMGKKNQLGTLEEVITLCRLDPHFVPVVDFGHLNARDLGGVFVTAADYARVFERIGEALGDSVARNLHCHFSKIEWTAAGEKKHLTFADTVYGPDYEPLGEAIANLRLTPTIICESAGTQAVDARAIKASYLRFCEK
ncbi:MAG: TIM barrel protein [Clostridia bacterium]|nr:TIM barrel protein [Clostridia bacterium]